MRSDKQLRYSIFDPTGNITALVESPVAEDEQTAAAAAILARHPEVEQVGFVRLPSEGGEGLTLRMAGGEFCGNASMSAAALFALRRGLDEAELVLRVSGAESAVTVRLRRREDGFDALVDMPPARSVRQIVGTAQGLRGPFTCVSMQGITHAVITPSSALFALKENRSAAEGAVRALTAELGADCLGLMFLEGEGRRRRLTPLVFVPSGGTLFWEKSCASGSAAVGMALSAASGSALCLELDQPGGSLQVTSDPAAGKTRLRGRTRLLGEYVV